MFLRAALLPLPIPTGTFLEDPKTHPLYSGRNPSRFLPEDDPAIHLMIAARRFEPDVLYASDLLRARDQDGNSVVTHAASAGNLRSLAFIRERKPEAWHHLVNHAGLNGVYPLFCAVCQNRCAAAVYLLQHGARVLVPHKRPPYPPRPASLLHDLINAGPSLCGNAPWFLALLLQALARQPQPDRHRILHFRSTYALFRRSSSDPTTTASSSSCFRDVTPMELARRLPSPDLVAVFDDYFGVRKPQPPPRDGIPFYDYSPDATYAAAATRRRAARTAASPPAPPAR